MASNKNKLEQLYNEHRKTLHHYVASRYDSEGDAEDVVQETFLRLATENSAPAKAFARASSPVAYLYRMARNLAVDKLRQAGSRARLAEKSSDIVDSPCDDPLPRVLASQRRLQQIETALKDLPPKRRQVFVLHKYRQLTYREIAQHLDISLSMVEKHMSQALAQLDEALQGGHDEH